jgi:hypothetical protein
VECTFGVYWCADDTVLEGIVIPDAVSARPISESLSPSGPVEGLVRSMIQSLAGNSTRAVSSTGTGREEGTGSPVVLLSDPSLVDLFRLLEIEELTPALAVRKFTLPALNRLVLGFGKF